MKNFTNGGISMEKLKLKPNQKIAIYSRKSKFTGKGESIGNQKELCKEYIFREFGIDDDSLIKEYEDEGFSGKNTNRPQFQKLMEDCRNKKVCCIVCYRLDRISRNTCDFALLIRELEKYGIGFHSINEKFDTNSTMGRAMMHISSIFAQLERETIAERIRDNMQELAKTGRWLGGTTPLGFKSKQIQTSTSPNGKSRTAYQLQPIAEEQTIVKLIFQKFLEYNSLTKTETYLLNAQIKTRNGIPFSIFAIRCILANPVYASADSDTFDYFSKLGVILCNDEKEFNGTHGIMAYNKTYQTCEESHKMHDYEDWIVAIGKHKPTITGKEWVKVQNLLEQNKSKSYRKPKNNHALLSGLLVCGHCGAYMRPKVYRKVDENGNKTFSYLCETKEKSRQQQCATKNPRGNELDRMVCDEIKKLSRSDSTFHKQLNIIKKQILSAEQHSNSELTLLQTTLTKKEKQISNYIKAISETNQTVATELIMTEISKLHAETEALQQQITELSELTNNHGELLPTLDALTEKLSSFADTFDMLSLNEKREILKLLIEKIVWDGMNVHLYLYGTNYEKTEPQPRGCK